MKLSNKQYAVGTYEIELQAKEELDYMLKNMADVCEYIDTAIDYNNDYLLSDVPNYKIISKMSFCHSNDYEFFVSNHLKCLKRDFIDIMLIHSNRGDWTELAKKINEDTRFKEVGVSNFNKEDIIKYKEIIGKYPAYNEIEINPRYVDLEVVEFCKENNIKIISYAICGGKYNAMTYVADYSLPYIISFAAQYADIIILRADTHRFVNEFIDVVKNFDSENSGFDLTPKTNDDDKVIVPMRYFAKNISKEYLGQPTYSNGCGKNAGEMSCEQIILPDMPKCEMLGDYKTYLRYLFRHDYSQNKPVYDYDFLIDDEGNYIVVYLYDEDHKITKVNHTDTVEVYKYFRGE